MNLATWDRTLRIIAALAMIAAAFTTLPFAARAALGGTAVYMLGTALAGTCLGYKMMGMSTCPRT